MLQRLRFADLVFAAIVVATQVANRWLKRGEREMRLVDLATHTSGLSPRQPYEELLLERICRPLGMTSTRLTLDDSMAARLIPGHDADGNAAKKWNMACLAPCGGISAPTRMER